MYIQYIYICFSDHFLSQPHFNTQLCFQLNCFATKHQSDCLSSCFALLSSFQDLFLSIFLVFSIPTSWLKVVPK